MLRLTRMRTKKMMLSRITGKLQIYELVRCMDTCDHFTADMTQLKTGIQTQFDSQGVDAQVDNCRQLVEPSYDYLLTDTWLPAESPILPIIIVAAIFIIKVVIVAAAIYLVSRAVHDTWFPTQTYYCDICGEGFSSIAELTAHRRTAHPEVPPYQCPYCGSAFNTAAELDAHVKECPLRGGGPDWTLILVIIAGIAVTVIVVPRIWR